MATFIVAKFKARLSSRVVVLFLCLLASTQLGGKVMTEIQSDEEKWTPIFGQALKCFLLCPQTVLPIQPLVPGSRRDGPSSHRFRLRPKNPASSDTAGSTISPRPIPVLPPPEAVTGSPVAVCARHRRLIKLPSAMPIRRGKLDPACADPGADAGARY